MDEFIAEFNDAITNEMNGIGAQMETLIDAMQRKEHRAIQLERQKIIALCKNAKTKIMDLESYGGDNRLRNSALDMLSSIRAFAEGACQKLETSLLYSDPEKFEYAEKIVMKEYEMIARQWSQMQNQQSEFKQRVLRNYVR